jgi:hypothetical protein
MNCADAGDRFIAGVVSAHVVGDACATPVEMLQG